MSLYTFLNKYLYHMLVEFEQNCMVQLNYTKFRAFWQKKIEEEKKKKKKKHVKHFRQSVDAILEDVFVALAEIIYRLMLITKLLIWRLYHLSVFKK